VDGRQGPAGGQRPQGIDGLYTLPPSARPTAGPHGGPFDHLHDGGAGATLAGLRRRPGGAVSGALCSDAADVRRGLAFFARLCDGDPRAGAEDEVAMTVRFDGRVAIVTGGGNGLGRQHCLQLAARGARVVVNDLGGAVDGSGGSLLAADAVAREIREAGGEAIASGADITRFDQVEAMVAEAKAHWGRVDILINNAGILRDKSFAKMTMEDFRKVVEVHLFGTANCTKAVWDTMREQNYGRIMLTASASGIYGNFGQSNYGAAKAAMVGLMNVLHLEGAKNNIRVNTLAPTAATRMLEGLIGEQAARLMQPDLVSPGVLYLVSEEAPSKTILGAGAGCFSVVHIYETKPVFLGGTDITVDDVAANWATISNPAGEETLDAAFSQTNRFIAAAAEALGVKLGG